MYKCIKSMTIYPDTYVRAGDVIKKNLYDTLDWVEKSNFKQILEENEEVPSDDDINLIDTALDVVSIGLSVSSIFADLNSSNNNSSSNDSPSFGGFDGRDFGGGGAGGDF